MNPNLPTLPEVISRLTWPILGLVTGLIVLAWTLFKVRNWLRESEEDDGCGPLLLAEYREMVRQGQLTEEEFRKIKGRMAAAWGGNPGEKPVVGSPTKPPVPLNPQAPE